MITLLNKFNNCDTFSLTYSQGYFKVTDEEFSKALEKIKQKEKEQLKEAYNANKLENYPDFDELYLKIENECYDFYHQENKSKYFQCSFIVDKVGKETKYGKENKDFSYNFYMIISMNIDREYNAKELYIKSNISPTSFIPKDLEEHLLYYEISFYNTVTESSTLMINYYFKLNDKTKKYLLQFKNDLSLTPLEDLTIYKDNEIKFYSCTHEQFNSLNEYN